jgi:hypothetical protein
MPEDKQHTTDDGQRTTDKVWRFGILAGIAMMLFALYPQFKLWVNRGQDWNGVYAYNDIDEVVYSAYLQALIDGRPRKTDPYTGNISEQESHFSIQFVAPYMIALPTRLFGVSSSTAMIFVSAFAAFFSALAIFWLLAKLTNDEKFAAVGALMVLCLGTLAAGEGAIYELTKRGIAYPYFPFLRRFVPAFAFPFFFAMCGALWCALKNENERKRYLFAFIATVCFAVQVYSYFFIWTVAFAWLVGLFVLWILFRPENFRRDFELLLFTVSTSLLSLVPYAYMLSNRSRLMDEIQLLADSHKPDLWRMPEIISYVAIAALLIAALNKIIKFKDRKTIFIFSLTIVPFMLFNQQIITGRSLQPIHYQVFIGNYVAVLAILLTVALISQMQKPARSKGATHYALTSCGLLHFSHPVLIALTIISLAWGVIEAKYTTRVLDDYNIERDEAMLVEKRLAQLAKESNNPYVQTVLALNFIQANDQPTIAPQPVLWARHQHLYSSITWQENKERFYQLIYFLGVNETWLRESLINGDAVTVIALFGWGRATDRLTVNPRPLTLFEIDAEVNQFKNYISNFNRERAAKFNLSYLITQDDFPVDFSNIDLWYEHNEGEQFGKFRLYRLKLRE